jgi:transcriptional regulator with XRE-family HTH domain
MMYNTRTYLTLSIKNVEFSSCKRITKMKKTKVDINDFVAAQIRELRSTFNSGEGISQEALAQQIGVAPNTISRWETSLYKPAMEDLEKIARFFGVSMNVFLPPDQVTGANEDKIMALLRAARQLHPADLEELMKYAEFRKTRRLYQGRSRPKAGRKGGSKK